MKIISSKMHGVIDYLFIAFVLASPSIFNMEGALATITYILGAVHLTVTILTDFELGLIKVIPFKIHGLLEVVVTITLAILAFWFYSNGYETGFYYYMALAIAIILVFILTDFKTIPKRN